MRPSDFREWTFVHESFQYCSGRVIWTYFNWYERIFLQGISELRELHFLHLTSGMKHYVTTQYISPSSTDASPFCSFLSLLEPSVSVKSSLIVDLSPPSCLLRNVCPLLQNFTILRQSVETLFEVPSSMILSVCNRTLTAFDAPDM